MFDQLGSTESLIILAVVILIFGIGRVGRLGGELDSGIRSFHLGIRGLEDSQGEKGHQDEA